METIYSLREAADYLGIKPATVRYHVYKSKLLTGKLVGNSLVFTQTELNAFKSVEHKPGVKPKPLLAAR